MNVHETSLKSYRDRVIASGLQFGNIYCANTFHASVYAIEENQVNASLP